MSDSPKGKVVGFSAYETQRLMVLDYDLKGRTKDEAEKLVNEGKARWVLEPGAVLTLEILEVEDE
jgi:hypothetical protein